MTAGWPYPARVLDVEAQTQSAPEPTTPGGPGPEGSGPQAPTEADAPPTEDVLARLRAKVAQRRAAGEYPADLPERMAAHFDRLLGGRGATSVDFDRMHAALNEARAAREFALQRVSTASSIPGGAAAHRLIGKATARQAQGMLGQVQASADATQRALDALAIALGQLQDDLSKEARSLDEQTARARIAVGRVEAALTPLRAELAELRARQDGLAAAWTDQLTAERDRETAQTERVAVAEERFVRAEAKTEALAARLDHVERLLPGVDGRIVQLEKAERDRGFRPWYDTGAFEARFRGSRQDMVEQYHTVGRFFVDHEGHGLGTVLDLGCGRGEFLEVLGRWKVDGYGVEIDAGLVEECRARGLRATLVEDGLAHLAGLPDESLGGLVLLQVIEHLSPQQQLDLIALAFRKLKFGGRFVVETLNASSLYVYANAMYLDPTHTRPVHPAYLGFLCEEIGFEAVEFEYRSPVPDSARLLVTGPADATPATAARKSQPSTRALEKLDALLHAPQDYLVVATK